MSRRLHAIGSLLIAFSATSAQQYEVQLLPHPGSQTGARSIHGGVLVGEVSPVSLGYPVAWTVATNQMTLLHPGYGEARAVHGNSIGGIIRTGPNNNQYRAALWRLGHSRPVFTSLHPARFYLNSWVNDVSEDAQVGQGSFLEPGWSTPTYHALLWRGSHTAITNLHPHGLGYRGSVATAVDGDLQAGYVTTYSPYIGGESLPAVWSGTAESFTLLPLPAVSYRSGVSGIHGNTAVGYVATASDRPTVWRVGEPGYTFLSHSAENGWLTDTNGNTHVGYIRFNYQGHSGNPKYKATAWVGDPPVLVDLHALLPTWITDSFAHGIDEQGNIVGTGNIYSQVAIVWKRISR